MQKPSPRWDPHITIKMNNVSQDALLFLWIKLTISYSFFFFFSFFKLRQSIFVLHFLVNFSFRMICLFVFFFSNDASNFGSSWHSSHLQFDLNPALNHLLPAIDRREQNLLFWAYSCLMIRRKNSPWYDLRSVLLY